MVSQWKFKCSLKPVFHLVFKGSLQVKCKTYKKTVIATKCGLQYKGGLQMDRSCNTSSTVHKWFKILANIVFSLSHYASYNEKCSAHKFVASGPYSLCSGWNMYPTCEGFNWYRSPIAITLTLPNNLLVVHIVLTMYFIHQILMVYM